MPKSFTISNLICNTHNNNIINILKAKLKLGKFIKKPSKQLNTKIKFTNIKIYVNGKLIKIYKRYFVDGGVVLKKQFNFGVLAIKKNNNYIKILTKFNIEKLIKVLTINYIKKPKQTYLKSCENNLKIKVRTYNKLTCFKVVNFTEFKTKISNYNFKIVPTMQSAMQQVICGLNFNDFITSHSSVENKIELNNFIKNIKHFKVSTSNKNINNLVNDFLPSRVINQLNNSNNKNNIIFKKVKTEFVPQVVVEFLLKHKQYVCLYNYILCNLLGVCFYNNALKFFNNPNYYSKFKIEYKGELFLKNNTIFGSSILYNGIVYNNVNSIKLQSIEHIKFDNLNFM